MRRFSLQLTLLLTALVLVPTGEVEARRSGKARSSKSRFSVLTFNVRFDFKNDGANRWNNRVDLVASVIQESHAKIVCLQEDKAHQVRDLQERLGEYEFLGRGRNPSGSGERCSILYKRDAFRLKDHGDFWLSDTPDVAGSNTWGDRYPRKVTWALLLPKSNSKKRILVLNTHLPNGGQAHRLRIKGAQLISSWLEQTLGSKKNKTTVILTGDFNDGEGSTPHDTLTEGQGFSLRDAWIEARPSDPSPGTFNGFRGLRTRERIDWILISGPVRVRQAAKVDWNQDGRYPSDHYPVLAELELR